MNLETETYCYFYYAAHSPVLLLVLFHPRQKRLGRVNFPTPSMPVSGLPFNPHTKFLYTRR